MGAQEWRDALFLRHVIDPADPLHFCNGCNDTVYICHALKCKQDSLVTARNNKLCDRVAELDGKYFTSSHIRDNPLICEGCDMKRPKSKPARTKATPFPDNTP